MPRTTSSLVQAILLDNYDGATPLQPFIEAAADLVSQVSSLAVGRGLALTAVTLELVERWLSAHFYARADKTYQSKSEGGASGGFTGQTGMGLDSTEYGQMAKTLDWTGTLVAIDKRQFAFAGFLGCRESRPRR